MVTLVMYTAAEIAKAHLDVNKVGANVTCPAHTSTLLWTEGEE